MDILVNFSDLVSNRRKDITSWQAAVDAMNRMSHIYPQCFSKYNESFEPLRVHANAASIKGIEQNSLEVFLAKFLLVLNNEVPVASVDYSGEQRFIDAGRQAAWSLSMKGGEQTRELTGELNDLRSFKRNALDSFTKEEFRELTRGGKVMFVMGICTNPKMLADELCVEFIAGGDRFTRMDISMTLDGMSKDDRRTVERLCREKCAGAIKDGAKYGVMSQDFLEKMIKTWITDNDISQHLGKVFEQYRDVEKRKVIQIDENESFIKKNDKGLRK